MWPQRGQRASITSGLLVLIFVSAIRAVPTGRSTAPPGQRIFRRPSESPSTARAEPSDPNAKVNSDTTSTPSPFQYFTIPPIPSNARDVHEVRIIEFIPRPSRNQNGTRMNTTHSEDVESRAGAMGPVLTPTDVRPEDSNLGVLGYHELLDRLWTQMNISRSCILYNNFDAVRGCDCQACLRAEPDFRTQLCAFGRAVRNSSELEEYIVRVMGPDAPKPREVFMLEDYYVALCDLSRCPRVPNRCCNPAFNPGVLRRRQTTEVQSPTDFYQVDVSGCPICHPVVPLSTPLPSLDRSCILEELFAFAPLQPLSLPTI